MQEVFEFVECADPGHQIRWNIESKINAQYPERTRGVQDFVRRQSAVFRASPYYSSITVRPERHTIAARLISISSTKVSIGEPWWP